MKTMDCATFLARVIDEGLVAARHDYNRPDPVGQARLRGAVAGFEACRGLSPPDLLALLRAAQAAREKAHDAMGQPHGAEHYWEARCFEVEVEWCCNVVSAALANIGAAPLIPYTGHGLAMAARILGVRALGRMA